MGIHRLPEEILIYIFSYLDSAPPPSSLRARDEPSLYLTSSRARTLKDATCVSKQWRRLLYTSLFCYARVSVEWTDAPDRGTSSRHVNGAESLDSRKATESVHSTQNPAPYHAALMSSLEENLRKLPRSNDGSSADEIVEWQAAFARQWFHCLHHSLSNFVDFVQTRGLASRIESLVLLVDDLRIRELRQIARNHAIEDLRRPAAAMFWQHLLAVINPSRVVIVACPKDLCSLTLSSPPYAGLADAWNFEGADYHSLELRQGTASDLLRLPIALKESDLDIKDSSQFCNSSILLLKVWHKIWLNEGNFVKGYFGYDYFERGPPASCTSILNHLMLSMDDIIDSRTSKMQHLKRFTYTAVFPFARHAHFFQMLDRIQELDVQLGPNDRSDLSSQSGPHGPADLSDCWHMLMTTYTNLVEEVKTRGRRFRGFPNVEKILCRDYSNLMLRRDLDDIFTGLCLPSWVEYEPGTFVRNHSTT